jgi:hypothetical protein
MKTLYYGRAPEDGLLLARMNTDNRCMPGSSLLSMYHLSILYIIRANKESLNHSSMVHVDANGMVAESNDGVIDKRALMQRMDHAAKSSSCSCLRRAEIPFAVYPTVIPVAYTQTRSRHKNYRKHGV